MQITDWFNTLLGEIGTQKTVGWRKLHNEELHNLFSSPSIIRIIKSKRMRWWVNNIKMDLREIGWDGVDWMDMAQDRDQCRALVNTVLNLRVL
jgi:hypothetical protein